MRRLLHSMTFIMITEYNEYPKMLTFTFSQYLCISFPLTLTTDIMIIMHRTLFIIDQY